MKKFKRFIIAGVVIVLLLVIALAVFIYNRLQSEPIELGTTRGDLAFMSDQNGNWDILMLGPDGELHNLTAEGDGHDFFFNFMFAGDRIGFYSTRTGEMGTAQVDSDGSDLRTLSFAEAIMAIFIDGTFDMDPAWGPGAKQLVWQSVRDLNLELYISDADGSNSRRLTDDGASDMMQGWSPDGQRLVFISDRSGKQNVYVLDIATGEETRLTEEEWDFQPVWSLEGDKILFVAEGDAPITTGQFETWIINPDGTDRHLLGEDEVFKGDPTYSPDGEQVAFMSNEDGNWHIYVMDPDGSNVKRVTDGKGNYMFPTWRPIPADEQSEQTPEATEATE